MVRCMSPKAQSAESRASIRTPGPSRRSPVACRTQSSPRRSAGRSTSRSLADRVRSRDARRLRRRRQRRRVGIYRVDGPTSFTVIADIGAFSVANPAETDVRRPDRTSSTRWSRTAAGSWSPTGTTTACCGSHSTARSPKLIAFDNIVPTGLAVPGQHACSWPRPAPSRTCPRTARSCRSCRSRRLATEVASGARLLVDVEFGRGPTLYALSQGDLPGRRLRRLARRCRTPAQLVKVNWDGTFTVVARRPEPADLARVHRKHRVRRHPRRGDLEDRSTSSTSRRRSE